MTHLLKRWFAAGMALVIAAGLMGCAAGPKLVAHSFIFDGWNDGWASSIDLLEFQYGDEYKMVHRKSKDNLALGYRFGVSGDMPIGNFLRVRWRIKESSEIVQVEVDLRSRLPKQMHDHTVTFTIDGRRLYVYLVTPRKLNHWHGKPTSKTWLSEFYVCREIYPATE